MKFICIILGLLFILLAIGVTATAGLLRRFGRKDCAIDAAPPFHRRLA